MAMKHLVIFFVLLMAGCGADSSPGQSGPESEVAPVRPAGDAAVVISMEGETYELSNINKVRSTVSQVDGEIRFFLVDDNVPVELNFNIKLAKTGILESGTAKYELPLAYPLLAAVDLNFFNRERDSKSTQKRILFSEGTIEIEELTENSLKMVFKGSGHPLTGKEQFPIDGSVNVTFPAE
jgi:hypothetical protein